MLSPHNRNVLRLDLNVCNHQSLNAIDTTVTGRGRSAAATGAIASHSMAHVVQLERRFFSKTINSRF
jgi:hypothetical protein